MPHTWNSQKAKNNCLCNLDCWIVMRWGYLSFRKWYNSLLKYHLSVQILIHFLTSFEPFFPKRILSPNYILLLLLSAGSIQRVGGYLWKESLNLVSISLWRGNILKHFFKAIHKSSEIIGNFLKYVFMYSSLERRQYVSQSCQHLT